MSLDQGIPQLEERPDASLVVLISGNGSNLQALLDACASGRIPAQVAVVISDQPGAYGLERARQANIPILVLQKNKEQTRPAYDRQLADIIVDFHPDLVILAGWMRILTGSFLNRFPGQVINLHPALPGTFPGTHAIERALQAYHQGEIQYTGVMVHRVPDEAVDAGPVLAQEIVPIYPNDSLESLEHRVHGVEHTLLVQTLAGLLTQKQNQVTG